MDKNKLPNATAVLVLGIFSILTCCCYGIVGLALGIVALVLAKKDEKTYLENPEIYSNYPNLKIGRILAIIGICLSAIYLAFTVYAYIVVGPENFEEWQRDLMMKIEQRNQQ